ncbi:HXXEE domain-containing protein [Sporolactobacillus putidus]|uniref:HXXEE domain-containing protein n=1 Tax=Sporolactobacillus putidus TaxID=492735 RepID=UPI001666DEBC|nr:HXXEE domain-containing protein [Sporolactobacillus putidus]
MGASIFLLFIFTISLHNTEEGIWLIRMTKHSKIGLHKVVKQDQFLFAVIAVTAMMLNVIFPHLLSTIIERKYSPGLTTGLLLIIPIHTIIIMRSFQSHLISIGGLIMGTLIMSICLILLIPVMFKLASRLIQ